MVLATIRPAYCLLYSLVMSLFSLWSKMYCHKYQGGSIPWLYYLELCSEGAMNKI